MSKGRLQLVLILVIAFGTPIAATLLYFYAPPAGTTNRGELVEPVSLPNDVLDKTEDDSWRMLVLGDSDCGPKCRERLCVMRQARLARMGDALRIERIWLVRGDGDLPQEMMMAPSCDRDLAAASTATGEVDVLEGVVTHRATPGLLDSLPKAATGGSIDGYIYLVDPQGLLMMRFPEDIAIKEIARDMRRLLRLSRKVG